MKSQKKIFLGILLIFSISLIVYLDPKLSISYFFLTFNQENFDKLTEIAKQEKSYLEKLLVKLVQRNPNCVAVMGPLKKYQRSKEKVEADYGGDLEQLGDILRCTAVCENYKQVLRAKQFIERRKKKYVITSLKNRWDSPDSSYKDINIKMYRQKGIKFLNDENQQKSFKMEVLITTANILYANKYLGAHKLYEITRYEQYGKDIVRDQELFTEIYESLKEIYQENHRNMTTSINNQFEKVVQSLEKFIEKYTKTYNQDQFEELKRQCTELSKLLYAEANEDKLFRQDDHEELAFEATSKSFPEAKIITKDTGKSVFD